MKKNSKGFTMVELLAVIVILGILSTIGIVATSSYLTQSRARSYKIMSQTIYEAAMNCMVQGKCSTPTTTATKTFTTANLIDEGYLEKLKNPISSREDCYGKVDVSVLGTSDTEYKDYNYAVSLKCAGVANTTLNWPESKTIEESEIMRQITESANNTEDPLTSDNNGSSSTTTGSNNNSSSGTDNSDNKNIVEGYTYNESTCTTGEEDTCVKTTCYKSNTANSCKAGDIIKYKVNDTTTVTFHVMYDNGDTLTMQSQKNTVYNIAWINSTDYKTENTDGTSCSSNACTDEGPITVLKTLENATSGWSNVNDQTYTMGTTVFKTNVFTGCSDYNSCTTNVYTLPSRKAKARMITVQEASNLGATTTGGENCPKWITLNNDPFYLNGVYNYGYWTMSADSSAVYNAWIMTSHYGLYHGTIYDTGYGARAVVVVNK